MDETNDLLRTLMGKVDELKGDMKSEIGRLEGKIDELNGTIGDLEGKVGGLDVKTDRIDTRTGFLAEHRVRRFIIDKHGHDWARSYDIRGLDGFANLLVEKTTFLTPPNHTEMDLQGKREEATETLADWCLRHVSGFFEMLHDIYQPGEEKRDYSSKNYGKNASVLIDHIKKQLAERKTDRNGGSETMPKGENDDCTYNENDEDDADKYEGLTAQENVLNAAKDLADFFTENEKVLANPKSSREEKRVIFAKAKAKLRKYNGLALSILFSHKGLLEWRKKWYGKRWAWSSLEFDCRGAVHSYGQKNFVEFGEIKSSTRCRKKANCQLLFRAAVLEFVRQILAENGTPTVPDSTFTAHCYAFYESGKVLEQFTKPLKVSTSDSEKNATDPEKDASVKPGHMEVIVFPTTLRHDPSVENPRSCHPPVIH